MALVAANWKMYTAAREAGDLASAVAKQPSRVERVLCPPSPWLTIVQPLLKGTNIALGAQDCHPDAEGAYTGDVSAPMLRDAGCSYCIVGHSERRAAYGETDALVACKMLALLAQKITPILCVGETLIQRDAGEAETTVHRSLEMTLAPVVHAFPEAVLVIAYEPVWAIGTGRVPKPGDIAAMHDLIRRSVGQRAASLALGLRVLYGGSVKATNAAELAAIPGVDGFLVGGASLNALEFHTICQAAEACASAAVN